MGKNRKKTEHVFSISELAAQLDISPRTIRFYEEKGLITPRRTAGNQRVYTPKDRARLKLILRGKRFGFSLDEIAEMIGMADTDMDEVDQIRKSLDYGRKKLQEIRDRMKDLVILEQDLLAVQKKLQKRLQELTKEEIP
ncbi:MerR family transcriptional regulator [Desulfosoma caldarium]|uniref:DNA-binding transcriptional MerR regulator n=1 Tax=Desulfosoma caldarium TaxID=610254 RepID=A0A3N1ULP5_9BACT|nr:MerR family DNA-binding transcriptional regulator [Desulfosoma caldarium]ROQ92145.1 DNA-binding transcriptional MerR regulator [Desulfosoma caldarium]